MNGVHIQVCNQSYVMASTILPRNFCFVFIYLLFFKRAGFSSEEDSPAPKHRKRTYMNQPHLRFEITSDDGFSVQASSIEGKTACLQSALN